ncbi:MAG TPA: bifunctional diguanylate cyclase/phosphodiesterase, partial [Gemmatimonadales bacterium]|nr:bifunctional diguanylate cyclase/phosphodiesterase [Gemmatimonadales bacterium]
LTRALRVDYAFVAEMPDDAGTRARMVALHANGTLLTDVEYALGGTPCHEVVVDGMCVVSSGARHRYPADTLLSELEVESYLGAVIPAAGGGQLGWVALMDRRPLAHSSEVEAILRLCAARAGAELERRAADRAARRVREDLERTLAEQTQTLRLEREKRVKAFRSSPDPIALTSVANGRLLEVNDAFVAQHGYTRDEVLGRSVLDLNIWVHPGQRQRMLDLLRGEGVVRDFEFEFRRRSGERRVALLSAELIDVAGESCVLAVARDVTAAFQDDLTGLPNRALFMDRLRRAVERTRRHLDTRTAVLFLDVDRFKTVNDSLGHTAGDRLLVAVAGQLQTCLRPEDTVARFGGDEFAILLEDVAGLDDAIRVADRIKRVLNLPVAIDGQDVFSTVSIGIALGTAGERDPEDLLRDADTALCGAKAAGRACYEIFDIAMHAQAVAQLRLETELRQAVVRDEFQLRYQPIVASGDGHIVGFEALLRWAHPTRGMLAPGEFLSMAEDTGLIVPIGRKALREACQRARGWQERHGAAAPWVSVNLCSRQFLQPGLVGEIANVLEETGLAPQHLMLEITENVIMDKAAFLTATLCALRDLGVHLSIDDFGTGYSSLSHLHEFPIDTLKIDRSFIRRLGPDGSNGETVRAIVTLAHNLTKTVIAEGVETTEQLTQVRALACDFVQGFLFSASVDAAAADALLLRTA